MISFLFFGNNNTGDVMIKKETLKTLKDNYLKDENNIVRSMILNKTALVDLATNYDDNLDVSFNVEIDTHNVVDQKSTGRCWSFAGLNILREEVIKKCNLDNFELSGSYIAFYDKLERFNLLMDRLDNYDSDVYDRYVQDILKTGFDDGSNFSEFKVLVKKYGVVPKNIFSNSFNSNDTGELNDILSRLLRKYYLELENIKDVKDLKEKYLNYAYKVLGSIYGLPKDKFDFEYIDKNNKYHIDKGLTPKSFYDKYIGIDFDNDYIEIYSYKDDKYNYNKSYIIEEGSLISGSKRTSILNLDYKRLEELIINQLKHNELVYFSSSTTTKYENGIWIDLMSRYSNLFGIDLNMNNNDIYKTYGTMGEHSMVITGVNTNSKFKKWKIENSWGDKEGDNGYFVMEDKFLKNYMISAVINKKYLSLEELDILSETPIEVSKWDYKFS